MSNKQETSNAMEDSKPARVPKLRFPEFREANGWDTDVLGDVANFVKEKVPLERVALENYVSTENILPGYSGVAKASKLPTTGSVTRYRPNDTLVSNIRPYLKKVWVADKEGGASNDVIVIRAKQSLLPQYLSCLLKNDAFIDYVMTGAKGVKMPRGDVGSMKAYPTLYPSIAEQQKIADCLSSLDELITAQGHKVDALKTHKKGLMQHLFPREGESQPRLRFPEFQNTGAWDVRTIGEMFRLINGCAFKPEDWKTSGTPIIRIQNLNDPSAEFNYSQAPVLERNRIESGDLLFAWSGTLGSSFGARIWNGPSGVLNQHIFKVLMDEQQITLPFSLLVLARVEEDIAKQAHGFKASFVHVKKSDLVKVDLPLPSLPEQQQIASCLTSLDALITANAQKLEALKTHKKGLMQQLFPTTEVVEA